MEYLNESPLTKSVIFDSHAHYYDERFDGERDTLFDLLPKHGVGAVVNCGCDIQSSRQAIELSEKYGYVYSAVGFHPENIPSDSDLMEIKKMAEHEKCVAIGEIGLDYYWAPEKAEEQKIAFEKQIALAKEMELPIIVHDREAHKDTLDILLKHKPQGVLHSYSGSVEMARELLKIGMYIGISGVVTFKNAKKLPDVVKMLPLDRLLLETDAPYLAPVPYRGKTNNSAMIYLTAEKIAEIKGVDVSVVLDSAFDNAVRLFKIKGFKA